MHARTSTRLALGAMALGLVAGTSIGAATAADQTGSAGTTVAADDVPPKKKTETTDKITLYIVDAKGSG